MIALKKLAMKVILSKLSKSKNRKAKFICSLSIKINKKKIITAIGKVNGKISKNIIGNKGFGYDPIFIPIGYKISYGQMSRTQKMKIDHRNIAFKKLKKKLKSNKFFIWSSIHIKFLN